MKVTLEPTDKVVTIRSASAPGGVGIQARIWQGTTDAGTQVHAYVTRIACPTGDAAECERFERELGAEVSAPRPEVEAIPARLIL